MPDSLGREPRGHPFPAPTWTRAPRSPRPAGKPYPRGRPRRLGGGGVRQVLPGNCPPTPHVLRKRNYGAKLVELSSASLERSLSLQLQSRIPDAPSRATFPMPDTVPPAFPRNRRRAPASAGIAPANNLGPLSPTQLPQHRHISASSLSCGVHVSQPGTRRFAASRGPPATLSPAPCRSRHPRSHATLDSDSPNRRRELHRQGQDPGPQSEAARLGLSVPGAPPSWPLNTQRCSDRRRRLAQPIVGRELHLPKDTARLRIPEGHAPSHFSTLEEDGHPDLPRGFLGMVVSEGRLAVGAVGVL